jgi:hypothetical protein
LRPDYEPRDDDAWVVEAMDFDESVLLDQSEMDSDDAEDDWVEDGDWDDSSDDEDFEEDERRFAEWPHDIGMSSSDFLIRRKRDQRDPQDLTVLETRDYWGRNDISGPTEWEVLLLGSKSRRPVAVLPVPTLADAMALVNSNSEGWPHIRLQAAVSRKRESMFPEPYPFP